MTELSPEKRGYGQAHRARRRAIAPMVEAGMVRCARCGELIAPGTPWDLGHVESVPPDATDWPKDDSHGNGKLWTLLWPYSVVLATPDWVEKDGSTGVKWPWWRGVKGELKIEGRRLDKPARPVRAEISPDYGLSGFQPSGIYFSGEGCWQVTGTTGGASLTFVTLVVKASSYGLELKRE